MDPVGRLGRVSQVRERAVRKARSAVAGTRRSGHRSRRWRRYEHSRVLPVVGRVSQQTSIARPALSPRVAGFGAYVA